MEVRTLNSLWNVVSKFVDRGADPVGHLESYLENVRMFLEAPESSENTQDQRLATADETTPADGIASPLHPLVRWRRGEDER